MMKSHVFSIVILQYVNEKKMSPFLFFIYILLTALKVLLLIEMSVGVLVLQMIQRTICLFIVNFVNYLRWLTTP